jgi:hypothetical protein
MRLRSLRLALVVGTVAGCSAGDLPFKIEPVTLTKDLLFALAFLIAVVGIVAMAMLLTLHRTDRELDITRTPLHIGTRARSAVDRQTEKMYNAALKRLDDLEQALVSIVEADQASIEAVTGDWLDFVVQGLATVLSAGTNAHFRVAIWTDDEQDPEYVKGLAWFGFDRHDPKYEKLPRATTLAGWVIANREDHYVVDVDDDPLYRPRMNPPRYRSMYAAPLGSGDNPWAAITVDAPARDGLSEERRALIRRFGSLASVGARIADRRMATSRTTRTTGS